MNDWWIVVDRREVNIWRYNYINIIMMMWDNFIEIIVIITIDLDDIDD